MSLATTISTHYAKLRQSWYMCILFSEILLKLQWQEYYFHFFGHISWINPFVEGAKILTKCSMFLKRQQGYSLALFESRWEFLSVEQKPLLASTLKNVWRITYTSASLYQAHPSQCTTIAEDLEAMYWRRKNHLLH